MNYIMNLRDKLGNQPIIMIGATAIIKNNAGNILLQKRSDSGRWGTIGGAMELGESFEETAKREVEEETSIIVTELQMRSVLSGNDMFHKYPNGDQVYLVTAVFEIIKWRGIPRVNDSESLELKFFNLKKKLPDIEPLVILILQKSGYL
jgi:8-oxo-dGTP pyrophosphatase MutT (NUDIX family)